MRDPFCIDWTKELEKPKPLPTPALGPPSPKADASHLDWAQRDLGFALSSGAISLYSFRNTVASGFFDLPTVASGQICGTTAQKKTVGVVGQRDGPWVKVEETSAHPPPPEEVTWYDPASKMQLFLAEMYMGNEERRSLEWLRRYPDNPNHREGYARLLDGMGRHMSAELVRNGWTPGK